MHDYFNRVRDGILGEGSVIETPFGPRRMTYADHAASGRLYRPIEAFLLEVAGPSYGNTHTETSHVGAQTSALREEARQIIKQATRCTDEDACIFVGNGVTGAINLLVECMGLRLPCASSRILENRAGFISAIASAGKPVVLIGSYEHHSNELPWRESDCDVEVIRDCEVDGIDLAHLRERLEHHRASDRLIVGSFSAGSNVTGRLTNVPRITEMMHDAGGVAFFDYAAAGPYVDVAMDGNGSRLFAPDAAFLSMHKFVGGPGSPGVLLAKKHLFDNAVPAVPGGGTISYVGPHRHEYLSDVEHREEGGTPNILGSIKAGLAMKLKMNAIQSLNASSDGRNGVLWVEMDHAHKFIDAFRDDQRVHVLGDLDAPRLGVVSFTISCIGSGGVKLLHHNFVVALLNDLFGVQARGGNSCAAPFAHRLLKISDKDEAELEACVAAGWHGCKPGWTRLSFGWYDSEDTIDYLIECVRFLAQWGHLFLDEYDFDPRSGTWKHQHFKMKLKSLSSPTPTAPALSLPEHVRHEYLAEAQRLVQARQMQRDIQRMQQRATNKPDPTPFENLRWFWLPREMK